MPNKKDSKKREAQLHEMTSGLERRFLSGIVELRAAAADGEKSPIVGHAAVFGEETIIGSYYSFREKIEKGAFARAIKEKQDVRALFNHDENLILGRTASGTLELEEDEVGLLYTIDPPDTSVARDLMESLRRGDVNQSSFAFYVRKQQFIEEEGKPPLRIIQDVDLLDVSPVTFPAYEGTDVGMRCFPGGIPQELKEVLDAAKLAAESSKLDARHAYRQRQITISELRRTA